MSTRNIYYFVATFFALSAAGPAPALEPDQLTPQRFFTIGDSTTRAFDANLPSDNLNASWANGYYGFWEKLFGLPNVKSHNQRITANSGANGRTNWTTAVNGARMETLPLQASGVAGKNVTYSTVLLGSNDACRNPPTAPDAFERSFRNGLDTLLRNLPAGATVQVVAVPDVSRLYQVGRLKRALGLVDCSVVWATTNNCPSVLSATATDADRAFVKARVIAYNSILKSVTETNAPRYRKQNKFIYFTDKSYTYPFTQNEISNLDCFHPSWQGQRVLSAVTWNDGPFKAYQLGN